MEQNIGFKKIFGNSMWQISEKILTMLLSVFVTGIVARYLGTEKYGIVNYVISVVMIFTAFSTLGTEKITINDLVNNKYSKEDILGTSFIIRIFGGLLLILISQITLYIITKGDNLSQVLGIVLGTSMIFKSFEVIEYYLQSKMNLKIVSIIRFSTAMIVSISKILVVVFDLGMIGFIFTYLIDAVFAGLLFFIWYKIKDKNKWKFNKKYAKNLLSRCWYIAVSGLMVTIYMRIDQVMLGSMLSSKTENGIYSAAVRIAEMWYFIPLAIIASFQPVIMKRKNEGNEEEYKSNTQRLYDVVSIIGIMFGLLISIFGGIAVNILYGEEYIEASYVLSISVWAGLFATLGSAQSVWLIAENKQKYTLLYTVIGAVVNVTLNAVLIPLWAAKGAALATLIAQFIANIVVLLFFKETRKSIIMVLKSIFCNKTFVDGVVVIRKKIFKI